MLTYAKCRIEGAHINEWSMITYRKWLNSQVSLWASIQMNTVKGNYMDHT